jgi:hypothetical protein
MKRTLTMTILLLAWAALPARPQQPSPGPTPCAAPEYRQFDFWVGVWEVRDPEGALAGTNSITPILGGCVLEESWKGDGGMSGHSYNTYVPARGQWHQTWVDDQGGFLQLDGKYSDSRMVLSSAEVPSRREPGVMVTHRITWERLAEGKVRQVWQASKDQGRSWSVVFDGTYSRKK